MTPIEKLQVLASLGMGMTFLLGLLIGRGTKRGNYNHRDDKGRFVRTR